MKRIITIMIISLLAMTVIPCIFSLNAAGDDTIPQPGKVVFAEDIKDSELEKKSDVIFADNDAYLAGWATTPYQFYTAIYKQIKNQRVTIQVKFTGLAEGYGYTKSGKTFGAGDFSDSEEWANVIRAGIYQEKSWVNTTVNPNPVGAENITYIKPEHVDLHVYSGDNTAYEDVTFTFSFLTNSTSFTAGVFAVKIQILVHWTEWLIFEKSAWEDYATIYGEFTVGNAYVDDKYPPNDSILPDENGNFPPAYFNFTVYNGWWRVKFWYVGNGTDWHINNGVITGDNVKPLKTWPSETGHFDKNSGDGGYIRLQYNFTENDSAGMYVWELLSVNDNGEILYSWTLIVHNDMKVLDTNGDGQIDNHPPVIRISFNYTEQPEVNKPLTIVVRAWDNDTGAGTITVYLFAFYSNNIYMAPDPNLNTMQLFMYAVDLQPDGTPKYVSVPLRYGGQFIVWAAGKDNIGAFNKFITSIMVKDFEGAPGGTGLPTTGNPWIRFPWESTLNMVILLIGVIMLFTRKPVLQMIGILLFFLAWINYDYLWQQITSYLNPSNWWWGVIL